jgi:hypothetical protein
MIEASRNRFPLDFLIIGTMKSGTSTLSAILQQHPEIGLPEHEVHYFDRNWQKGDDWYRSVLESCRDERTKLIGEKTPDYTLKEDYARGIHRLNPNVRLIWLFRNPADRAYSHYLHNLRAGRENLSFEKALLKEQERISKDLIYGYDFGSRYADMVERYLPLFPKERMKFVLFEDFVAKQEAVSKEIMDFLGIAPSEQINYSIHSHKTMVPKKAAGLFLARKYLKHKGRLWNYVYRFYSAPSRLKLPEKMDPQFRSNLLEGFKEEGNRLKDLTGLNVSRWFEAQ